MLRIFYGVEGYYRDVTDICIYNLKDEDDGNIITIPRYDNQRADYFNDHLPNVLKHILVKIDDKEYKYGEQSRIKINLLTNEIIFNNSHKLQKIHDKLIIKHGLFKDEYPEQLMIYNNLKGNEKVLEIGGNIGRSSLVIASILQDNNNFVSLECNEEIAKQLEENRDLNNFTFKIENSALSKRKLIQKGMDTIPSDTLFNGFKWVNTITLDELRDKYKIDFDTLMLDCEGAFYYILQDMPDILNNIKLIIMENDYHNMQHKIYIDNVLKQNNFYRSYYEEGGWGPCFSCFFEVWKKNDDI